MFYVALMLAFLLMLFIPMFSMFIQTIKNLLAFITLIIVVCINLMLFFHLEFFPIFLMLVYIGAIIVTTLFMVLTFDLRYENNRRIFEASWLENVTMYFTLSTFFYAAAFFVEEVFWVKDPLDDIDRLALYSRCLENNPALPEFCDEAFGKKNVDKGLYHLIGEKASDIVVISDNLYTTYGQLLVVLGVILTVALLAAVTLLKNGKSH